MYYLGSYVMIGVLLTSLFASLPVTAANLVSNSSFETVVDARPENWLRHNWHGQAEFNIENEGRVTGHSVRIDSTEGADASWYQLISIHPYGRYRLSGWIKTDDVQIIDGRGVLLNVHGIPGAETPALTGDNDWTFLETEFDIVGGQSLQINCLLGGWGRATGTAWFDDIKLEFVKEIVPESNTVHAEITLAAAPEKAPISKYIYGQFIEHLGQCIYGGIWAEMLEDRKFYFPIPATDPVWTTTNQGAEVLTASPWLPIGDPDRIEMSADAPLSGRHSPRITVSENATGLAQERLGLVAGKEYTGHIVLRVAGDVQAVTVRLVWENGAAETVIPHNQLDTAFTMHELHLTAGADTDNGRLEIIGTGNGSFTIGAVSLMPEDNVQGFRADTLVLMKQLNSPIYRWPGGNFVSGYDWRDGLGDRDRRPTRTNPAWTGIETNDVGMDEFIALCRLLDAEPLITVNTGFGDAYSAAAQVEYTNGAADTLMGALRAENGSPEPFNVKWWCVGNEMWGNWQLGYMQLEHYILKHNWVEEMMRQVDPDITTIASGSAGPWSEGLLTHCAEHMDYIAEHFYTQSRPDITEHAQLPVAPIRAVTGMHRQYRRDISGLVDKDIRIAFTEWNYWYGPHVFGELGTRYFMKDALGIAIGLHEYFRHSDIVHMALYAQTVNVIGCIKTTPTAAEFDATALPLMLYRNLFGKQPVEVTGWDERLDVAAALTEDETYLTVGMVNATWDTYEVTLNTGSYKPAGDAAGWRIANPDPLAYNHPGQDRVIDVVELPASNAGEKIVLPPVSITLYSIPIEK